MKRILVIAYGRYNFYISRNLQKSKMRLVNIYNFTPYFPLETTLDNEDATYDEILLAIEEHRDLERILLVLHHKKNSKVVNVIRLHALREYRDFVNRQGDFEEEVIDRIVNDTPYLVYVAAHINDNCNLNCAACNNYSPFCSQSNLSVENFEEDIFTLSQKVRIGRLWLYGGEPLLEPELSVKFIEVARKYCPSTEIQYLTNGLLIPKMSVAFWEAFRRNTVIVYITQYPPTVKLRQEIMQTLQENQVEYYLGDEVEFFAKRLTKKPLEDAEKNSRICGSAGCHYIRNGKISKCPDAQLVQFMLDKTEINIDTRKDIHELSNFSTPWDMIEVLAAPSELCKYCACDRKELIPWHTVSAPPQLDDWFIEDREVVEKRQQLLLEKEQEKIRLKREETEREQQRLWESKNADLADVIIEKILGKSVSDAIFIPFGAGNRCYKQLPKIMKLLNIRYIADNNSSLWNTTLDELGVRVLSPAALKEHKNIIVIIMLYDAGYSCEVAIQLEKMGIPFIHMDSVNKLLQ